VRRWAVRLMPLPPSTATLREGMKRGLLSVVVAALALAAAPSALAGGWWPHPADATWTYRWADTAYNTAGTTEKVIVKSTNPQGFTLDWTSNDLGNADDAVPSLGTVALSETPSGVFATPQAYLAPPDRFPILCAQAASCANVTTSTVYQALWGSLKPVLAEPLLKGRTWTSVGGQDGSVTSISTYTGTEQVTVPAFPGPVEAARVTTTIRQAGAIGDPYGSGVRTVWWVYGIGPVKISFVHAGGAGAPVTTSLLKTTNQRPQPAPKDVDYFPMVKDQSFTYRWTNKALFAKPVVERATVDAVVNSTARITLAHVSGPIQVAGSYIYSRTLDGLVNTSAETKAATRAKLLPLGPKALPPARRRHFFTPFDLLDFGLNPILPAYPAAGASWASSRDGTDWVNYGVTGSTSVVGIRTVKVPAGRFAALVVRSKLTQRGFPFGTGTRTAWFAPGRGLVKLVFAHARGGTSVVELLR
jgi:hypothetical protein